MIYIVMGVMGSGKSTIGAALAEKLGCEFINGNDFHSNKSREKMYEGIPLEDHDRKPWILDLRSVVDKQLADRKDLVLECSVLKEKYRTVIIQDRKDKIKIIYLKGTPEVIEERIKSRKSDYASPSLLQSQLDTLEEPQDAKVVDIRKSVEEIVKDILKDIVSS